MQDELTIKAEEQLAVCLLGVFLPNHLEVNEKESYLEG